MPLSRAAQRNFERALAQAGQLTLVDSFQPNPGGQELVCRSKKHQIWFLAGNKVGKSYMLLMKLAWRSLPEYDAEGNQTGWLADPYVRTRVPRRKINNWVSTYSQPVQRETLQPEFDRIFEPYLRGMKQYSEKGVRFWAETPVGVIHFKWQQAEKKSYEGANIDFAALDEPHDRAIYNEICARFAKTRGYLMVAATLVIDPSDPEAWRKLRYVEWMAKMASEWESSPESYPELDIIYGDVSENPHIDAEFQLAMMAGMSAEERMTRQTGRVYSLIGKCPFDRDKLATIESHLQRHSEQYEPEYGVLEYMHDNDVSEVVFVPTLNEFPDYPKAGYIVKVWERPVESTPFVRPEYFIGVDVATGKSTGDYTCAYVMRGDTGHIVASLHGHLSEIDLARQLYLLGMYYHDAAGEPAMCAVEVVSIGATAQTYMITGHGELGIPRYGLHRLYHRPAVQHMERGLSLMGTEPGWYTSNKTRPYLITSIRQIFLEAYHAIEAGLPCPIPDPMLVYEGKWFIANKQGKYEAAQGKFDDRIIAAAITQKCMEQYSRIRNIRIEDDVDYTDDDTYYIEDGEIVFNVEGVMNRRRNWIPTGKDMIF